MLHVFKPLCAYADSCSHLSGYLLPSFGVLSNLLQPVKQQEVQIDKNCLESKISMPGPVFNFTHNE